MNNKKEIEQLVLGAILLRGDAYWEVEDILSTDAFQFPAHKQIYSVIRDLALEGKVITRQMVVGRLTGGDGFEVDPDAYVSAMIYAASKEDTLPLQDYSLDLRQEALWHKLDTMAKSVIDTVKKREANPQMVLDRISERVADMAQHADIEHESTLGETVRHVAREARADGSEQKGMGVEPCLHGLTDMIGHIPPGSLVLLAGGPGSGKTALLFQQLLFSSAAHPCTLFELEMDNRSLVARSLREYTNISSQAIMTGISPEQEADLFNVAETLKSRNLRMVSPPRITMPQLRSRAMAHKKKYGLDIMGVDHLKLIEGSNTKYRDDPVARAYQNAKELKVLSKELRCVTFVLCQLTKAGRAKDDPEPEMEDIYGGALEEHADIILALLNRHDWLQRNPPKTNKGKIKEDWDLQKRQSENRIEVYKLKHRFSKSRDRRFFHWDGARTLFQDISSFPAGDLLDDQNDLMAHSGR